VKRLLSVFVGSVGGTFGSAHMTVAPTAFNLRSIVIPVELRPDEWPRFRYIFLELWRPNENRLAELVKGYRLESRKDVLSAFYRQKVKIYCKEKGIDEKTLSETVGLRLKKDAKNQFEGALVELVGKLPESEHVVLHASLDKPVPPTEEEITSTVAEDEIEEVAEDV
jgi:hypothetical protein